MVGTLYVVATPIGNLADLSERSRNLLREVQVVVAEDTRRTRGLLSHVGAEGKTLVRIDAHASDGAITKVIEMLCAGQSVALVTDAGTPVVSDPGSALVAAAHDAGVRVVPLPGPSAVIAALSASGFTDSAFRFIGFLPRKGRERRAVIEDVVAARDVVIFFEAANRLAATLSDLAASMPDRPVLVARELTKIHEELVRGRLAETAALAGDREWLGEVTVVLGPQGAEPKRGELDASALDDRIDGELKHGRRPRDIAEGIALELGMSKRDAYARVVARKNG